MGGGRRGSEGGLGGGDVGETAIEVGDEARASGGRESVGGGGEVSDLGLGVRPAGVEASEDGWAELRGESESVSLQRSEEMNREFQDVRLLHLGRGCRLSLQSFQQQRLQTLYSVINLKQDLLWTSPARLRSSLRREPGLRFGCPNVGKCTFNSPVSVLGKCTFNSPRHPLIRARRRFSISGFFTCTQRQSFALVYVWRENLGIVVPCDILLFASRDETGIIACDCVLLCFD